MTTAPDEAPDTARTDALPEVAPVVDRRPTATVLTSGLVLTILAVVLLGVGGFWAVLDDGANVGGFLAFAVALLGLGLYQLARAVHRIAQRADLRAGVPAPDRPWQDG